MDSLNASLEAEQTAKLECLRMKKKIEGDINDLEITLDQANKAQAETQKTIKRYQNQVREAELTYEEEHRLGVETLEKSSMMERKALSLKMELCLQKMTEKLLFLT